MGEQKQARCTWMYLALWLTLELLNVTHNYKTKSKRGKRSLKNWKQQWASEINSFCNWWFIFTERNHSQSLLCTVPVHTHFSCHGLNDTSPPTQWFKFQWAQQFHKAQTLLPAHYSTNHCLNNRQHHDQWPVMSLLLKPFGDWSLRWSFSSCTDSKACHCVASLSPSDKPVWPFTQMHSRKRELANKDQSAGQKQ